jgi:uncharacterized protein (TIGR03083 family)
MEYGRHIESVERETGAFAAALRGPLDAPVPTCPDWTLADLAEHAGGFTGFWTHVLCEGTGRAKTPFSQQPPGPGVADWYQELAGHLVAELRATAGDTEVWTWAPDDHSAGFVARRVAHELSVHRFDAQLARGHADPIEAGLAADGIEEIFMMIVVSKGLGRGEGGRDEGQTLHLHGTDRGDEWLVALTPEGLKVERRHGKGDLALRGAVSDLELVLYQRPPLGDVERFGDSDALAAWYRAFTFG